MSGAPDQRDRTGETRHTRGGTGDAPLREGFTTGSAAAAAAKAATLCLLTGAAPETVDIPLPPDAGPDRLTIPIAACEPLPQGMRASVTKDGGDDPDATHGATVEAEVRLDFTGESGHIMVHGGKGVGRVTLPGLPVAVGEAAINPGPRAQIAAAVGEALATAPGPAPAAQVTVSVPEGERIAAKTLNPRLGIVGGVSILGTRGTVRPFSHEAWEATIRQGLNVAKAAGCGTVGLATGRRTERLLMARRPDLPALACIQAADFYGLALREAAARGFRAAVWSCFFGKLVKMAQGHFYTHAATAPIDFDLLAQWCCAPLDGPGVDHATAHAIAGANTARQVLDILHAEASPVRDAALGTVARHAARLGRTWAGDHMALSYYLFDFDGNLLAAL
ncbi:MAG: cobalt-precorrin-5B (C(1))-methyltransferase CbiD [Desulfovibrionaceae bacterium]